MDEASSDFPPSPTHTQENKLLLSPLLSSPVRSTSDVFLSPLNPSHSVPPHFSLHEILLPRHRTTERNRGVEQNEGPICIPSCIVPRGEEPRRSHLSPPSPWTWKTFSVVLEEGVRRKIERERERGCEED
ncbi:hypothetical protein CGRA01v4_09904 [Colletotrichum graminicola]|nr:hypothetical protein CGRA01v4_09904 [Colletotrichum graminicola]